MLNTNCNLRTCLGDTGSFVMSQKPFILSNKSENNITLNTERIKNIEGVWLLELTDYNNESESDL